MRLKKFILMNTVLLTLAALTLPLTSSHAGDISDARFSRSESRLKHRDSATLDSANARPASCILQECGGGSSVFAVKDSAGTDGERVFGYSAIKD